jgi:predicted neutral ceramidase superfamily lipid hydrolase
LSATTTSAATTRSDSDGRKTWMLLPNEWVGVGLFAFSIIVFCLIDVHAGKPFWARILSAGFMIMAIMVGVACRHCPMAIRLSVMWVYASVPLALLLNAAGLNWLHAGVWAFVSGICALIALALTRGHHDG